MLEFSWAGAKVKPLFESICLAESGLRKMPISYQLQGKEMEEEKIFLTKIWTISYYFHIFGSQDWIYKKINPWWRGWSFEFYLIFYFL